MAAGLAMLLAGRAAAVVSVQQLSLVLVIGGLALLMFGWTGLRSLWFPIAYLLFMIPVWDVLTDGLHAPFQNASARLGVWILHALGLPAYRDGVVIELPQVALEVARVCSGVNYLIAVLAVGIPVAYLYLESWLARTLVVMVSVVVAALSNGLRVAMIGVLWHLGLAGDGHGPYHVLQGLSVSVVGYAGLFLAISLALRLSRTRGTAADHRDLATVRTSGHAVGSIPRGLFVALGLLVAAGGYVRFTEAVPVNLQTDLEMLPLRIGAWEGRDVSPITPVYRELGVDQDLSRVYRDPSGRSVQIYLGYFAWQAQGKEIVHERALETLRGAVPVTLDLGSGARQEARRLVLRRHGYDQLVIYWYDLRGRTVTDPVVAKSYAALHALRDGRSHGAVVMLAADLEDRTVEAAQADVEAFLRDGISVLSSAFVPRRS